MSRIVSFRGLLADGGQDTIALHTNDGSTGYRIVKFEIMTETFVNAELLMRIWKTPGNVGAGNIDFSDNRMLAAAQFSQSSASETNPDDVMVIFDSEIFNQDIYITNNGVSNARTMNYYIELEQVSLDLNENTVATLRNIRNND
jgi:hypothetical protein